MIKYYLTMGFSHEFTEEDIKFRYINDAIIGKGWTKDSIFMEQQVKFTGDKTNLHGNFVHREKPKFAFGSNVFTIDRYLQSNSDELKHNGYILYRG